MRINAQPGKGKFRHSGFAHDHSARLQQALHNSGVSRRVREAGQPRSGERGGACNVEQIFNTDRHAIKW